MEPNKKYPRKARSTRRFKKAMASSLIVASVGIWLNVAVSYAGWKGETEGYLGKKWENAAVHDGAPEQAEIKVSKDTALRGLSAGQVVSLLPQSAYFDTLTTLFGEVKINFGQIVSGTAFVPGQGGILAEYTVSANQVILKEPASEELYMYRAALTHELVHAWQAKEGDILGEIWERYNILPPADKMINYASYSKTEHQAEATAAAVGFLNILGRVDLQDSIKVALGRHLDALAPGTLIMTRVLLSHPVYAFHPIKNRTLAGLVLTPIQPARDWHKRTPQAAPESSMRRRLNEIASTAEGPIGQVVRNISRPRL